MTWHLPRPAPSALTTLAAFLLPALALWLPSGYSYGAVLLFVGALWRAPTWLRRPPDAATAVLALLLVAMGAMWFVLSLDGGFAHWDKGLKWMLGAACLLFVAAYPPQPLAFVAGLPLGCIGMGVEAWWQTGMRAMPRAEGFTNAIQWGNVALLLGCLAMVAIVVFWRARRWPWRALMALAIVLAITASLLSQSRGGWIALVVVLPLCVAWARQLRPELFKRLLVLSLAFAATLVIVLAVVPRFQDRIELAVSQVSSYVEDGEGETSLGVRLQQYRLAADMIAEKPWFGWGAQGFVDEMHRRVQAGLYGPALVHYPQIHNDLLDVWVKVGVFGMLLQLALFAWVMHIFWPLRQRLARHEGDPQRWRVALALRAMGALIPVAYLVFGMSQPFFNHNSGIMVFIFYVAVLWGGLQGIDRVPASGPATQRSDASAACSG